MISHQFQSYSETDFIADHMERPTRCRWPSQRSLAVTAISTRKIAELISRGPWEGVASHRVKELSSGLAWLMKMASRPASVMENLGEVASDRSFLIANQLADGHISDTPALSDPL